MQKNLFDLTGKKAIVTGGAGEIGFAMAEALHDYGAEVVVLDVSDKTRDAAKRLAEAGGAPVYAKQADLTDRAQISQIVDEIVEELGSVDILVNSAGINRRCPAEDFSEKDWDDVIAINVTALFLLCQKFGRVMLKQGKGKIINVASAYYQLGGLYVPAYTASKGAVAQLSKALNNEWMGKGINVNVIAPGYTKTVMNRAYFERADYVKIKADIDARLPAGRWGEVEDMKGATVFLASAASDFIGGIVIPIDGGLLAR